MPQLLRVQNFSVSADGYGAGADQTLERPFGHADPGQLLGWAGATAASWSVPRVIGSSSGCARVGTERSSRAVYLRT